VLEVGLLLFTLECGDGSPLWIPFWMLDPFGNTGKSPEEHNQ
jgi:hypothetical protein